MAAEAAAQAIHLGKSSKEAAIEAAAAAKATQEALNSGIPTEAAKMAGEVAAKAINHRHADLIDGEGGQWALVANVRLTELGHFVVLDGVGNGLVGG